MSFVAIMFGIIAMAIVVGFLVGLIAARTAGGRGEFFITWVAVTVFIVGAGWALLIS